MKTFWQLMRESTIIQGLMTLSSWFVVLYLCLTQQPVPEILIGVTGVLTGFWFKSKQEYQVQQAVRQVEQQIGARVQRAGD